MKAEQIINLKVVEVEHGASLGNVTGLLIDARDRRIAAVAVGSGILGPSRYVPFDKIVSVEHDVLTVPNPESLVERRNFRTDGMVESLSGRKVVTEDGHELGDIRSYNFDVKTGELVSIEFAVSKAVLGGLWHAAGDRYEVPAVLVKAIGENVVVDNSVPEVVGMTRAA